MTDGDALRRARGDRKSMRGSSRWTTQREDEKKNGEELLKKKAKRLLATVKAIRRPTTENASYSGRGRDETEKAFKDERNGERDDRR